MPERIQRQRTKGWRKPAAVVNVCRPCDWSNPFRVGDALDLGPARGIVTITQQLAVELFRAWVFENGWEDQIRNELHGQDLMCWCPPWEPCHADVLLELANPPAPAGMHWEPVVDHDWRLHDRGLMCRQRDCDVRADADLLRPTWRSGVATGTWWAYCSQHMYGRWIADDRIWLWRAVPDA